MIPTDEEPELNLAALFHQNTKNPSTSVFFRKAYQVHFAPRTVALMAEGSKRYVNRPSVALPAPQFEMGTPLIETILSRRSERNYSGEPLPLDDLAAILKLGNGVLTDTKITSGARISHRATPSSGGLGSIELYAVCRRVSDLDSAVYHYNADEHHLTRLRSCPTERELQAALFQVEFAQASVLLIVTGMLTRITAKYGDRGYRLVHLDGGHVGQNICLVSTALGVSCSPNAGFVDAYLETLADIDGVNEIVLCTYAIGRPPRD